MTPTPTLYKLKHLIIFVGEFVIGLTYVSKNGTGTGEMDVDIRTVDGIPVGKIVHWISVDEF